MKIEIILYLWIGLGASLVLLNCRSLGDSIDYHLKSYWKIIGVVYLFPSMMIYPFYWFYFRIKKLLTK